MGEGGGVEQVGTAGVEHLHRGRGNGLAAYYTACGVVAHLLRVTENLLHHLAVGKAKALVVIHHLMHIGPNARAGIIQSTTP